MVIPLARGDGRLVGAGVDAATGRGVDDPRGMGVDAWRGSGAGIELGSEIDGIAGGSSAIGE